MILIIPHIPNVHAVHDFELNVRGQTRLVSSCSITVV